MLQSHLQARTERYSCWLPSRDDENSSSVPSPLSAGSRSIPELLTTPRFSGAEKAPWAVLREANHRSRPPCPPERSEAKTTSSSLLLSAAPSSDALVLSPAKLVGAAKLPLGMV